MGLHHLALKVGDSIVTLVEVKKHLESNGVPVHMVLDHRVSQGVYVSDPDGNLLELYADADPAVWHNDPLWWPIRTLSRSKAEPPPDLFRNAE